MTNPKIQRILQIFPKSRPPLPPQYESVYVEEYQHNRENRNSPINNIKIWLESWMHKQISSVKKSGKLLEVGAGTLNHVEYESGYSAYDIVEPFEELIEMGTSARSSVNTIYEYTSDIPMSVRYDHIISVATFEHMLDLPKEMEEISDRLADDGLLQVGIPSEGGLAWYVSWKFFTGSSFWLRRRLSYAAIMKYEHVNKADEIIALAAHYFADVKIKRFPFNHKHLSFYTYFEAKKRKINGK